eukprot:1968153-Rhodomonas_salina.5
MIIMIKLCPRKCSTSIATSHKIDNHDRSTVRAGALVTVPASLAFPKTAISSPSCSHPTPMRTSSGLMLPQPLRHSHPRSRFSKPTPTHSPIPRPTHTASSLASCCAA